MTPSSTSLTTRASEDAEAFFGGVTRSLLAAEAEARVSNHVVLSIIGIDKVPTGYYTGKQLQERLVPEGNRPWSILRATQFFELAEQALSFATVGPFSLVPAMRSQPVAAREVAGALVGLAEAGPSGRVADLAGPEVFMVHRLAREVSRARGLGRRVVPVRLPGAAGRGLRDGSLTPDTSAVLGTTTFAEWLAGRSTRDRPPDTA